MALMLAACGGGGGGSDSSTPSTQSQTGTGTSGATAPQTSTGTTGTTGVTAPQTPTQSNTANTVPVIVSSASNSLNSPRVSVTVCQPGTTSCTTIPNIIVDTGSTGLRLFKSSLTSTLALPPETNPATNDPIGECLAFGGGPVFGQVVTADIQMAGEVASAVPIQIIDSTFASVPASCSSQGSLLSASTLEANGIIGVSNDLQDCGQACATVGQQGQQMYFDCNGTNCDASSFGIVLAQQVTNPVSKFATDNNGVILSFPDLAAGMAAEAVGTMTFGVGTQADNSASNVSMVEGLNNGMQSTINGASVRASIDSGSSVDYIANLSLLTCSVEGYTWYCPSNTTSMSAAYTGGGSQLNLTYDVANANSVLTSPAAGSSYAVADLAMPEELFNQPGIDLGMSYLFGHTLYLQYPNNSATPMIGVITN